MYEKTVCIFIYNDLNGPLLRILKKNQKQKL